MAKKKESALQKPVHFSEDLAEIVGKGPLPRTEITKKLWVYIKKHKLQDEKVKRNIKPDTKLGKIVGSKTLDMFAMTKHVSKHIKK